MTLQIPKGILEKIPKLYSQEHNPDPMIWIKWFTPWTSWTWYGIEYDGIDRLFGYVIGLENELGYFSLQELSDIQGPGGLGVERDIYFKPVRLSQVKKEHI